MCVEPDCLDGRLLEITNHMRFCPFFYHIKLHPQEGWDTVVASFLAWSISRGNFCQISGLHLEAQTPIWQAVCLSTKVFNSRCPANSYKRLAPVPYFHVAAVFFDIRKVFHSIPRDQLLTSLNSIGIYGPLLRWFSNYLSDRRQQVVLDGYPTSPLEYRHKAPSLGHYSTSSSWTQSANYHSQMVPS